MELAISAISSLFATLPAAAGTAAAAAGTTAAAVGSVAAPMAVVGSAGAMAVPTFMGTAAAGGLGAALGGTSLASSILSGGVTALSVLRTLQSGREKSLEANMAADQAADQAQDERAAGARRRLNLSEELYKTLGENDVTVAASGLDLSYGYGKELRATTMDRGARELSIDRATEEDRVRQLREREKNYRRMARGFRSGGTLSAALAGGEGALNLAGRYA